MIKWLLRSPPKVGRIWKLRDRWKSFREDSFVIVLDVRHGQVIYTNDCLESRYDYPPCTVTIRLFRELYKEI